jgi:hypothetical protein
MPFIRQLVCGGRLGVLAILDLGGWRSVRNVDLELDQEFHEGTNYDRASGFPLAP